MIFSVLCQKSLEEIPNLGYADQCRRADIARSDTGPRPLLCCRNRSRGATKAGGRNVRNIAVCDCDLCDCDHHQSEHAGICCKQCAVTWSPEGGCRAGGFTNSETRLTMLTECWSLYPFSAPDCINGVAENGDAECYATGKPGETVMELAFESFEEREQEAGLSYASQHH
jgi:hypothetical protein